MGDTAARLNARLAVEADLVRRAEHLDDVRLAAAVLLAPRLIVCEALLAGIAVPARRLDRAWAEALDLTGDVVLDDQLALAVLSRAPIENSPGGVNRNNPSPHRRRKATS